MRRKIVKQGTATMTISLPSKWVKQNNLKEGDEVEMTEEENKLVIGGEGSNDEIKKIEIKGKFGKNDLSHLYMVGYDEVVIHFDDEKSLNEILDRVNEIIGFEVIDQTEKSVTIKNITSELDSEYDNILRKTLLIQKDMNENIVNALKNKEFERLKQIRRQEVINNKFTGFLVRIISKKGYANQSRSPQAYDMIQNLERVADQYKYLCDDYIELKKINDEELDLLIEANELFLRFYDLHYKLTPEKKHEFRKLRRELFEKTKKALMNNPSIMNHHVFNIAEKIYNVAGSFFAINV
ncbi:hypothetical protein C0585_08435 [Candidatus Woesearchaeota archaeon]|nr:MAG: hypothetical protein C0585_08435 [Candidatus Woesearchaeota archaeon]